VVSESWRTDVARIVGLGNRHQKRLDNSVLRCLRKANREDWASWSWVWNSVRADAAGDVESWVNSEDLGGRLNRGW
jgi:hypothetical protein